MEESYKKRLLEYAEEVRKELEKEGYPASGDYKFHSLLWRLIGYIEVLKEEKEGQLKCKKD